MQVNSAGQVPLRASVGYREFARPEEGGAVDSFDELILDG